ncbi:tricarballylate utilization 4Fe-4S protein TcuB [Rhodopseudomonas sp. HC1]|uniref:tricarballylate utilization 4Fe-4S protein TcuB n=1 Tax=Rhodopseudomonas infernalis TaxID=2897386 RepID=UPI001EE83C74|nr:tricarballylate utilization 4Fe-4S protein TcuB [Rhodopseudomonas infernalis]MCG6203361.1 tricarballylate utilization 4Fe-4S protein TcuB [Rhodopseudomonas infernalis]
MSPDELTAEAERQFRICTACMYCDGLCPVFPAIDNQHRFELSDLNYLSNLCHNCRGCWTACQYTPPHPFAINLPATLAAVRQRSYADYLWPAALGHAFRRPFLSTALMVGAALLFTLAAVLLSTSPAALLTADAGAGAFYRVLPWPVMAGAAGASLLWAVLCIALATLRYWRAIAPPLPAGAILRAIRPALRDIVTLRHLGGGGPGCNDVDDTPSHRRRIAHHVMVAGFIGTLLSTMVAAIYHHGFGWLAPYPLFSLPVMLGGVGGVAMLVGIGGLLTIERRADKQASDPHEVQLNVAFLILLALVTLSGLAVLALRDTAAMGGLLSLHLGLVFGFFLVLPVTKAIHAPFRAAALLRAAAEAAAANPSTGMRGD